MKNTKIANAVLRIAEKLPDALYSARAEGGICEDEDLGFMMYNAQETAAGIINDAHYTIAMDKHFTETILDEMFGKEEPLDEKSKKQLSEMETWMFGKPVSPDLKVTELADQAEAAGQQQVQEAYSL